MTSEEKKALIKLHNKEYYLKNKEAIKARVKQNTINNKENIDEYQKQYRENHRKNNITYSKEYYKNNKEECLKKRKIYTKNNRSKINKNVRDRKKIDMIFKIKTNLRTHIAIILKKLGYSKKSKLNEILGCSYEVYKQHIENQWESWMNWDNYGLYNGRLDYGWDVDHIKPLSLAKTYEEVLELFNYKNTKPLCSRINRDIKKAKYLT
jgi:hypothetical protein